MELKLNEKIKAAVEINGEIIVNLENSQVFEKIEAEEGFIFIKSEVDGKEIKIRFMTKS